jgi:predicted RNase H-like nuclease
MNRASDPSITFAGADGCPAGWVVVTAAEASGSLSLLDVRTIPSFAALLEATSSCAALSVDIPIGLAEDGSREADTLAKRLLRQRQVCVFYAPARILLHAPSHSVATARNRSLFGKGISQQAYNIFRKIEEADRSMTPHLQERVVESHPEVSFAMLNGGDAIPGKKKSKAGKDERRRLLETAYGPAIIDLTPPRGAAWDDLYDACVLAWTASHVANGTAVHLPAAPQRDARGLRMEIVY